MNRKVFFAKFIAITLVAMTIGCSFERTKAQWSPPQLIVADSPSNTINLPRIVLSDSSMILTFTEAKWNVATSPTDIFLTIYSLSKMSSESTINLSRSLSPSRSQIIKIDRQGFQHVFWLEQIWRKQLSPSDTDSFRPSAIVYRNNEMGVWSNPIILFELDSTSARWNFNQIDDVFDVLIDEKNTIHLAFSAIADAAGRFIRYMKRENGRWTLPNRVAQRFSPSLAVDKIGTIYIGCIGANFNFANPIPDINSVFLITTSDKGITWSKENVVNISGKQPGYFPVVLTDKQNRVHLLWAKDYNDDLFPDAIWHSYSNNGGATWSLPDTVAAISDRKILFMRTAIDAEGQIHLVFQAFSESDRFRLYYVTQRNERWLPSIEIRTEQVAQDSDIAIDKQGRVYIAFVDRGLSPRGVYMVTSTISTSSAPESATAKPQQFQLFQNYPNPFNPTTVISYQLPASSDVSLKIYDMLGREAATLVNARQAAGRYEISFNAAGLASGMYIYRLQAGSFTRTMKMMLVK